MNKRIECIAPKVSLYVIISSPSLQFSVAIIGKKGKVVSSSLMSVSSSLTMENISKLSASPEPSQQGVLPIVYTRLHPDSVMKRQLLISWGPVSTIGGDSFSPYWMGEHLEILEPLNALGLVVNVELVERMEVLQQRADGLLLLLVIYDNPMQALQLNAYPVLITETEISQ